MASRTLDEWLDWQLEHHPKEIDLGLERVRSVANAMGVLEPEYRLVTVAGTNGKGSSIAMLEAILLKAGYSVASYTSPHLHRYNERIRISGAPISDELLCEAFESIDAVRGGTSLSYFEWGTLAAMWVFKDRAVRFGLLEVGLGGRLDAVNILDADVMLVTSIGIDHTDWLGDTRELISLEKLGIGRENKPMVCSDPNLPEIFVEKAIEKGILLDRLGIEFSYSKGCDSWAWRSENSMIENLPFPALVGEHQLQNASGVIAVLDCLEGIDHFSSAIGSGLQSVALEGRFERVISDPRLIFDVAHNLDSMASLLASLRDTPVEGETWCLMGVLNDKDIKGMIEQMDGVINHWLLSSPLSPRALAAKDLFKVMTETLTRSARIEMVDSLALGLEKALEDMGSRDRLVVTGSFFTVAQVRELISL